MCYNSVIIKSLRLVNTFLNVFKEIHFRIWLKAFVFLSAVFPFLEVSIPLTLDSSLSDNILAPQNFPNHSSDEHGSTLRKEDSSSDSPTYLYTASTAGFQMWKKCVCLKTSAFPNLSPEPFT